MKVSSHEKEARDRIQTVSTFKEVYLHVFRKNELTSRFNESDETLSNYTSSYGGLY